MRTRTKSFLKATLWIIAAAIPVMLASIALQIIGIPPRSLAPYIERRATGHNPAIEATGNWVARMLVAVDRADVTTSKPQALRAEDQPMTKSDSKGVARTIILVKSPEEAWKAIVDAHPGDVITFMPGTYRFAGGKYIHAKQPGKPRSEITVRAERQGTVQLEFDLVEGFLVSAPYWIFENLSIRGICGVHSDCEHAFHIVGGATHFVARKNTIVDFNAHFKINASDNAVPDYGLIEGNILRNSSIRRTANPVTPIDLVAASHWTIRGNSISDFVKAGGDQISYGAFAKGAGEDNRFEQNLVVCESLLRGQPGQRVGLSLGGGGSYRQGCRDRRCITEQQAGVIQSNLIMSCSDDGIYINKGAASLVRHNTLIDTGPIVVRFPESSADVEGNLVDSTIQSRNGSILRDTDNRQTGMSSLYLGWHPIRRMFVDAGNFDFRWRNSPPRRLAGEQLPLDLCGGQRPSRLAYGASEDYSRCLAAAH